MNLYIRLILFALKLGFRAKMSVLETSSLRFHVLPNDLDFNMHMNNGRYLTIMDFGRFDLMIRTGLAKKAFKNSLAPILGSAKIRYRIPLKPFQAFDLETRTLCWDEKWVYMEQRFIIPKGPLQGAAAAIALVKASLYDTQNRKSLPPQDMLALINQGTLQSPSMPDYVQSWQAAEKSLQELTAK